MREARARILARLVTDEATIDREMRKAADALARELTAEGVRPASVARLVARDAERRAASVTRVAEQSVRRGAREGAGLDRATYDAVFGVGTKAHEGATIPGTFAGEREAEAAAARVLRGELVADRVSLSRRVWANARDTAEAMTREVQVSLRTGESVVGASERLVRAGDPLVRLPRYVTELRDAARNDVTGSEVASLARTHAAQIERLGVATGEPSALSIRSASKEFARQISRAQGRDIERTVERWAYEKARYQARLVVRTETVRALRTAYDTSTAKHPYVVGLRWVLSSVHPKPDVCDVFASVDAAGLGPGGYPPGEAPGPGHPACLCTTIAIVDEHYFDRQRAQRQGTAEPPRPWESGTRETPAQWMHAQPESRRLAILGPGRAELFARQPGAVLRSDGSIASLREARGLPRTTPPRGEVVRVKQTRVGARELARRPARG